MQTSPRDDGDHPYAAVLVAASAGGLQGLEVILGGLAATFPVPVLVAQHLNRAGGTRIVPILSRATALPVKLAEDGERAQPGTVYIAPPDHHLCVQTDWTLSLSREHRVNYARPAADPLFESAAQVDGPVIGCVLTGADSDGAEGVKAVKKHGGAVLVQDPETAEFRGMPRSAIDTGQVDYVLPVSAIGPAITKILQGDAEGVAELGTRPSA
ncbi:chemotaxis protein CheB [Streptomyces kunmingensis]|uniref:protein-glutamate methylesterase n=1 Tax=Streptomyces kunmingensis TaxID=68225 RepID=A0ABU6C9Z9_9ACTN|nr:chemotaxis protein CheB [Streptomyces kunmingensis]MEB3961540.1 chemotaxis protein CheB [Streptomyces kunmingensis]